MKNKKIINKKFHHKMALGPVVFSMLSFSLMIVIVLILFRSSGVGDLSRQADGLERAITTQNSIIQSFIEYSKRSNNTNISVVSDSVKADHAGSMAAIKQHLGTLRTLDENGKYLVMAVAAVMLAHLIVIYFYLFYKTHNIYEPIHYMMRYIEDVKNRKKPPKTLRAKSDEFALLYYEFSALAEGMTFAGDKKKKKPAGPAKKKERRKPAVRSRAPEKEMQQSGEVAAGSGGEGESVESTPQINDGAHGVM